MNQPYNRGQLKRAARAALRQTRPRPWKVTVVMLLLNLVIGSVLMALVPTPDFLGEGMLRAALTGGSIAPIDAMPKGFGLYALSMAGVSILSALVTAILQMGYSAYALNVWRGQPAGFADLFCMFPRALRVIGASFLMGLFAFLWSLLAVVPTVALVVAVYFLSGSAASAIAGVFGYIGIIVLVIWVALRYAMAPYWLISDPDCRAAESIRRSKEAMRGNKGRLLVLGLSFIGWGILLALVIYLLAIAGAAVGVVAELGRTGVVALTLAGGGLGFLLTIPLSLFLEAYVATATMGFFDVVAGFTPEAAPIEPPVNPEPYRQVPPRYTGQTPPAPPTPPAAGADGDNWALPKD